MISTCTKVSLGLDRRIGGNVDAVALFIAEGADVPREQLGLLSEPERRAVGRLLTGKFARGKAQEIVGDFVELSGGRVRRVLLVGLGSAEKVNSEKVREAAGRLARQADRRAMRKIAVVPPLLVGGQGTEAAAVVSGFLLASHEFDEYKGAASRADDQKRHGPVELVIIGNEKRLRDQVQRARVITDAQNIARTLASRPGNEVNPPALAAIARELARELKLRVNVLDEKQMKRLGMGGILAVGSGSATPPRIIALEYRPNRARNKPPVMIVGKGITFDAGGISIKPAEKMGKMVYDKSGAVDVLGIMYAVAKLKLPASVVGILAAAENTLGGRAYRPGDLLRMHNGVTVEVTNTDAEGRLVLGDALAWGIETYKPAAVIDIATLTGGVVVALGTTMAGVMCNDEGLMRQLQRAAEATGEKIWRLPVWEEHREQMKSTIADIINAGNREASPLQGGAFLSYFVPEKTPWAHVDIAGVSDVEKELPYYGKGPTGWGVRTLVEWIEGRK